MTALRCTAGHESPSERVATRAASDPDWWSVALIMEGLCPLCPETRLDSLTCGCCESRWEVHTEPDPLGQLEPPWWTCYRGGNVEEA